MSRVRYAILVASMVLVVTSYTVMPSAAAASPPTGDPAPASTWTTLAPGLDLGRFRAPQTGFGGDATITVLRADPARWSLDLLCATAPEHGERLTAREWCRRTGAVAAINGGMFASDYETHVGYCAVRDHVNSAAVNDYQSVAAFYPKSETMPAFRIFDLDEPNITLDGIRADYEGVVQNLRLIKRPGRNRWGPQPKRWSEAALGEDEQGRILFIFSRTAYSMHDLNGILLSLPLDLVCAQHLEGGPEAQLFVGTIGQETEYTGCYETGFNENDGCAGAIPVPVVFALRERRD